MSWQGGDDKIAELLKQAYPPAAASPAFKANLRLQVNQQAAALAAATPKPLWQQPFVWIPTAAACAVAAALIIIFVAFQSVPPTITTRDATGIQTTTATLNGRVDSLGESESVEVSFEWGLTTDYGNETVPELRTESGDVSASLSGLKPSTTYHYRLKVVGREGIKYGPDMQFTTGPAPPTATTGDAAEIETTSATLRGSLDDMGSATSVKVSFEWGLTPSYGNETTPESVSATGAYSADLNGLTPGTMYYYRARAEGDGPPVYGVEKSFTTLTMAPTVTTNDATGVATTSATLNGELTSLGTAAGVAVSFEWGTASGSYTYTTADQARTVTGVFSASLSGLGPGTTYYFRAVADGDGDPVYGSENTFTTLTTPPSVTTEDAADVATTSAILNGNLAAMGTANSVAVCFEYGTATGLYTHTTAGESRTSTGSFSADLSDLDPGTTYYFRAKADGDGNPVYGLEKTFTTLTIPPSVRTDDASNVASTAATLNGDLTSLGTAESVTVSFEWGTTSGSYTHGTADQVRTTTGVFSADLSDLDPGTTYYFRARADGDGSPIYGEEKSFTTLTIPPSVRTSSATGVRCTSAMLNGVLDILGTASAVEVSFEWGLTAAYGHETTPETRMSSGDFSASLTGLIPGTTYHFRAKAVGDGVAYGDDMMFTTGNLPSEQRIWYLSADGLPGQRTMYVMYDGDTSKTEETVAVRGIRTLVWGTDQASDGNTTHDAGTWTIRLALSHMTEGHEVDVEIGTWDGSLFTTRGTQTFFGEGDDNLFVYVYTADFALSSFTVPSGGCVAVRVGQDDDNLVYVHAGGSSSYLASPSYPEPTAPTVSTRAATGVDQTTAVLNGYLDSLGSANAVAVCFEWGTTTAYGNETEVGFQMTDGSSFSFLLVDLAPNTTYHFRVRAVGDGTNYGIDMTFTTPP